LSRVTTVMFMDEPRYGYGRGGRPLWSPRDRDAEAIRRVLRRAGLRDFDELHPGGFAVEGANASEAGDEPFYVAYCGDAEAPATLRRYRLVLEQSGLRVSVDPQDEDVVRVERQSVASIRTVLPPGRALLTVAIVCAVLAALALVVSWVATGQARLVGGIGSGVLGGLAVFLAALWYRRRLDEPELD
jgi:hypothetical protein